ncbi:MAG: insulinase family protein, partial [Gammaproteobacteria bacterium]|nr:insulinase family protein [Gammaproteobacteria bacterium]
PAAGIELNEAQAAIQQEIELLKQELVQQKEIERVITKFIANWVYSQDDLAGQARMIGNLEVNGLNHKLMDALPQQFQAITAEDLQRVARHYLIKDNLSTLYLLPKNSTTNANP